MSNYLEIIAAREGLWRFSAPGGLGGEIIARPDTLPAAIRCVLELGRPAVLWVHEGAAERWHLPPTGVELVRDIKLEGDAMSSPGWLRISRDLHVALPSYSGDFAGLEGAAELGAALALFADLVGMQFMFSAPSTVLALVGAKWTPPSLSQPSGVPYVGSAFAIPAHTWTRAADAADRKLPAVQLFDRKGSYLAAWRSCVLPVGAPGAAAWLEVEAPLLIGPGGELTPGYWLIDVRELAPFLARQRLYDPFARAHGEERDGPIWLTAPLARLAAEIAREAGVELRADRAVLSTNKTRALDTVAERLGDARRALEASDLAYAPAIVAVIKDGYTRGTAHLEFGRKPGHPLHRPEWRHTIIERSVANTYRSLRKAERRPLVVGGIDAAVFAVVSTDYHDETPIAGLREGVELGTWHRRGTSMPRATALRRLGRKSRDAATNARALIATLAAS